MDTFQDDSLALHADFYEINMMKTYWEKGISNRHAVFECYYRTNPFHNGYTIFAGLERVIDYIENLRFTESDLHYLREEEGFEEDFLAYLKEWRFKGTIRAMKEGNCFCK